LVIAASKQMAILIRNLAPEDRASWEPLWRGYQQFYGVDLQGAITEILWARLHDPAEPVAGLGAFESGRLAGIAHTVTHRSTWMIADTCYLQDLFVVPEARGRGVARALIEAVYAAADASGAAQVYWLTHVSNSAGRRLYDRLATHAGFIAYERHVEAAAKT
jgi:GNAT superfamily N-acetyltransferase